MITPFDWQEGIGNRAQYIEGKLKHGSPVVAVSLDAGILIYTRRRQTRKIYEIYDRLAFAGIGQQSDVEALRTAAVEFAHQEGYNRSEQDVTIQRVATAISSPVKRAFADFSTSPLVVRSLFAEVGSTPDEDQYFVLDYDGDYRSLRGGAIVSGVSHDHSEAEAALSRVDRGSDAASAAKRLEEIWKMVVQSDEDAEDLVDDFEPEALLVERETHRDDRFKSVVIAN